MQIEAMGERIRDARNRLGLTQTGIADALQVSAQAVSKWERGENAPDITIVPLLAQLLGVTTDWLLGTTSPEGPTTVATVVFTDMKAYAMRVRDMPPNDVATLINAHFYQVTEVMLRYDAVPVKYLGDAFLSFFAGPNHAERALNGALRAQSLVTEDISIGVATGEIFIGRIGHPSHANLDIIGETVNHAALAVGVSTRSRSPVVAAEASILAAGDAFAAREIQLDETDRSANVLVRSGVRVYAVTGGEP